MWPSEAIRKKAAGGLRFCLEAGLPAVLRHSGDMEKETGAEAGGIAHAQLSEAQGCFRTMEKKNNKKTTPSGFNMAHILLA